MAGQVPNTPNVSANQSGSTQLCEIDHDSASFAAPDRIGGFVLMITADSNVKSAPAPVGWVVAAIGQ
jgi:hypothetical protein